MDAGKVSAVGPVGHGRKPVSSVVEIASVSGSIILQFAAAVEVLMVLAVIVAVSTGSRIIGIIILVQIVVSIVRIVAIALAISS